MMIYDTTFKLKAKLLNYRIICIKCQQNTSSSISNDTQLCLSHIFKYQYSLLGTWKSLKWIKTERENKF